MIRMARRVSVITGQGHDRDGQEEGHSDHRTGS